MNFQSRMSRELQARKSNHTHRELKLISGLVDFSSNDYLGLAQSRELSALISRTSDEHQITNGATGSRLLTGNSWLATELELKLSRIFKGESALLFNSGYTANLAVLSTLPKRGDTILYDELAHACVKDGARLSLASRYSFKHNSVEDLEIKARHAKGQLFVAVESVYSMDGDTTPLKDIIDVCKKLGAIIILDEAHSTGVYGSQGSGLACELSLQYDVDIRIHTFGKALGVHGACVIATKMTADYLINFARPFIYTTALTPHSVISIACAFDFLEQNSHLQKALRQNISFFNQSTSAIKHQRIASSSAIQTILIDGNTKVKEFSRHLNQHNLDVRAIVAPTVKPGTERIRICLHAFNTRDELILLTNLLQQS